MKKEILITTRENDQIWAMRLYTDKTYEALNGNGEVLFSGDWIEKDDQICHLMGGHVATKLDYEEGSSYTSVMDCSLNDLIPGLNDLIALEQLEKSLFGK